MIEHALTIKQLSKRYSNGFIALDGIDLKVQRGDFFALLGPNGAGKSTTLGIVCGLVNKTAGEVQIFGHDIDKDPVTAKRALGVVPQEFNFNQFEKVKDIIITQAGYYGIRTREAEPVCAQLLKQLDLWDKRDSPSRMLSGGMKRRLMIARALVHKPRLLILDEPTAGVDIELRRSMWEFLRQINEQGTSIILTTHYLEEAESLCQNIAIIDAGRIVQNTSTKALLSQLHVETYVLDTYEDLASVPRLEGLSVRQVDSRCLEVDVEKSRGLNPVFQALEQQGIRIASMRTKANRLEELFVRLVGQQASALATSEALAVAKSAGG